MMPLDPAFSLQIINSTHDFPPAWDDFEPNNLFLSATYLNALRNSCPQNVICHFVGVFFNGNLVGKVLVQKIDLRSDRPFQGSRNLKNILQNKIAHYLAASILIIGNNMLTGQNAFLFKENVFPNEQIIPCLLQIEKIFIQLYQQQKIKIHVSIIKDIDKKDLFFFETLSTKNGYSKFEFQPNMIFPLRESWHNFSNYLDDLNTKYRTQYNRAKKKATGLIKKKMDLEALKKFETEINKLYDNVRQQARFNTFALPLDHFYTLQKNLKEKFYFYGYFSGQELVGFYTIIEDGDCLYSYFLGYDKSLQKDKQLYINMLYDMLNFGIEKKAKSIALARTAMEIKSSIGAEALAVYGFMKHHLKIINYFLPRLINSLEPKTEWQARNPFK